MKGKENVIGFICVMLSCILVIGITFGLLRSANNKAAANFTTDAKTDSPIDNTTSSTTGSPDDTKADSTADMTPDSATDSELDELPPSSGLEWGFVTKLTGSCVTKPAYFACRSDKNTFDVDDVRFTIYYGEVFYGSIESERKGRDIPKFYIICLDADKGGEYLIREVNENFVSEEYRVTTSFRGSFENFEEDLYEEVVYNHSEEIVIPKEVFNENKGRILLMLSKTSISRGDSKYNLITGILFEYDMVDPSSVLLTPIF